MFREEYKTANKARSESIIMFCFNNGIEYRFERHPECCKQYQIYFTLPDHLMDAYNDYINANKLF